MYVCTYDRWVEAHEELRKCVKERVRVKETIVSSALAAQFVAGVCVCVYVYMFVCMCVRACVRACVCVCVCVCMCVCVYIYIFVWFVCRCGCIKRHRGYARKQIAE